MDKSNDSNYVKQNITMLMNAPKGTDNRYNAINNLMECNNTIVMSVLYTTFKMMLMQKALPRNKQSDTVKYLAATFLIDLLDETAHTALHLYDGTIDADAMKLIILSTFAEGLRCRMP